MLTRSLVLSFTLHATLVVTVALLPVTARRDEPARVHIELQEPSAAAAWSPLSVQLDEVRREEPAEPEIEDHELPIPQEDFADLVPEPKPAPGPAAARRAEFTAAMLEKLIEIDEPAPEEEAAEVAATPAPPAELVRARRRAEDNEAPRYPPLAKRQELEGAIELRIHVTAAGTVDAVELARPCAHAILNQAAVRAAEKWRFVPATRDGVPVPDVVELTIAFRLTDP